MSAEERWVKDTGKARREGMGKVKPNTRRLKSRAFAEQNGGHSDDWETNPRH